jgi:hypothetical protein
MSLPKFTRLNVEDPDLGRLYSNLEPIFSSLQAFPFFAGNLIEFNLLALTTTPLQHKLLRKPNGWFVVQLITASASGARIWQPSTIPADANFLYLQSDVAASGKLWVF